MVDGGRRVSVPFVDRVALRNLPSGGRLAVLPNPHAPTVTIAGMLRAGPATALDGRWSVPSLTASLLERGAGTMSRLDLARELEDHGLQLSVGASTSVPSGVSFSVQGLAEELPRIVSLLATVLQRPTFPADELTKVRSRGIGALRHEAEDASQRAYAELTRLIYPPGHPRYRRAIVDREAEVLEVTRDDLELHHRSVYGTSSLLCVVVGQVEVDVVAAMFGDAFAAWQPGLSWHAPVADIPTAKPERRTINIPDRPNLDVFFGHASDLLQGDEDYAAAILANSCLGQSTLTSRLGVAVRDEAGLTYGINSGFYGRCSEPGPWVTSLGVAAPNLDEALDLSMDVIRRYVEEGPTEQELDDERLAWAGGYRVGLATNTGVALEVVKTLAGGLPVSRLDRLPAEVLSVTRPQVVEALRRHIHPDRIVTTVAGTVAG